MMKMFRFLSENILFVFTLFLLAFIPLYPKLPLLDVVNTWVYIRIEDVVILSILFAWTTLLLRRKISLQTPLTMPILLFWIIGAIATIHGVLLIFPGLANVFPNVAFLSFLRRIEYLSLFFIAYGGMKNKRFLLYVIGVLVVTLFCVALYGIGQKYLGFPAYLTMNEEFAKGVPIQLSSLSRVPSTFAGHYDLAAYLVLVIPILTSLLFGFRNWFVRAALLVVISLGIIVLFMTVSRVSFFVLFISLFGVFVFQKRKLILFSLPFLVAIVVALFLLFAPALSDRFGNTVKEINVLVDPRTGEAIGHVQEVDADRFKDKSIRKRVFQERGQLIGVLRENENPLDATPSAIYPFIALPPKVILLEPPNTPTGENLPQGTGYINLSLSPVTHRIGSFLYEKPQSDKAFIFIGDFLIKRAAAYDLSFTTRFQGEWPNAIAAFRRNILFGSGFGSISLAVDNNYLRLLGEIGLLGIASFLAIFVTIGIYIKRVLPQVDSPVARSFVVGFAAGLVGLALNGLLIDVFEASKVAFVLWLLTGVTLGTLHFYQTKSIDLYREFKNVATATPAIILYLLFVTVVIFSPMIGNFFVGDDFTWFRWASDCSNGCPTILNYFTQADGFFYRPGAKVYFLLMHSVFWLNQAAYHMVSILLHFIVAVLVFLLAKKILRDSIFPVLCAFLFLIMSGYSEVVFWTSATGFLFTAVFSLLSLLFFIIWEEKRKRVYFILSLTSLIFSLLFHELGIVTPLLIIMYKFVTDDTFRPRMLKKTHYMLLFLPLLPYLLIRFAAGSHWFSGDYSYNILKLPYNVLGNAMGYFSLAALGPISLPFYQILRNVSREHMVIALIASIGLLYIFIRTYKLVMKKLDKEDKKVIIFATLFFLIGLLPFLGLGNIASRYSYLASFGVVLLFAFVVKKLYGFLVSNGKEVALAGATMVVTLFCLLHIMQLQQIHSDWYEAGEKTKRFFIAFEELYVDHWAKEPVKFYFVNVPIRVGEAWVFPVGLPDALWLVFRNPDMQVYQSGTLEEAMQNVDPSKNEKVFEFEGDGRVIERIKKLSVQ